MCKDYTLNDQLQTSNLGELLATPRLHVHATHREPAVKSTDRLGEGFRTRKQAGQFCPSITLHYKNTLYSLALASSGARGIHKCSRTKIFLSWGIFGKGQTIPPWFQGQSAHWHCRSRQSCLSAPGQHPAERLLAPPGFTRSTSSLKGEAFQATAG